MATTNIHDSPQGLSFEQLWAGLADYKESLKETERLMREAFREAAERQKEIAERQKKTDEQMKKTDQQMKETDRRIGELGNRFGELAEHLVAPGIAEKFNALGYHFDAISPGGQEIRNSEGKVIAEVDILLENSDCIMAVEVKTRPRIKDIEHHIKRLEILREHRNKHNDTRKIYGAIAGAVFGSEEKQAAIEAGFYVLEQTGDTMKMDIPQNFIPREF